MADMAVGRVFIEVELSLSPESDREKHGDPDEQGLWLAYELGRKIKDHGEAQGVAVDRLRFWGPNCQPQGSPLKEFRPEDC